MALLRIDIEPDEYTLTIELDGETTEFTLEDLKTKFPAYEVATTVQCAANRSEDFHGEGRGFTRAMFNPPHWRGGAFSTAKWKGPRMRDVLEYCGLPVDDLATGKYVMKSNDPNDHPYTGKFFFECLLKWLADALNV